MRNLEHYVYVNRHLVDEYASQLGIRDQRNISKVISKVSVSFTGPKFESNREYGFDDPPLQSKLEELLFQLTVRNLVATERPVEMGVSNGNVQPTQVFCFESVTATKVTFLKPQIEQLPGVTEMAVWIADPDPAQLSSKPWAFEGTFLLLPQINFDNTRFEFVHSGCSALQAVMNGYEGKSVILGARGEPLGRGSYQHPIEKLAQIGGTATHPQRIRVLYRMRYITNEQCYTLDGKQHRVNDLLAYPLFIAAA